VSLESANARFGALLRRQIAVRSAWLKAFLAFLALLVATNVFVVRPAHEAAGPAHPAGAMHGEAEDHPGTAGPGEAQGDHQEMTAEAPEAVHGEAGPTEEVAGIEEAHGAPPAAGTGEPVEKIAGVDLQFYPRGTHEYGLTRRVGATAVGRAVLAAFHYIHEAEALPAFWALFGVFFAWVLVRLSKGAAHTFLGKSEDFYDR